MCVFGYAEEGKIFSETYTVFLERLPILWQAKLHFSDTVKKVHSGFSEFRKPADAVVYHLGELCAEDFCEILILCQNGFGIGALKLLRGFYERIVTMAYISKNPNEAEAFIGYDAVHEGKELNKAEAAGFDITKHISQKDIDDIKKRSEAAKGKYQKKVCSKCGTTRTMLSWSPLDTPSMASKTSSELFELLWMCWYQPTVHGHATLYSIKKRLKPAREGGALSFDESAQREKVGTTLFLAHTLMLYNFAIQNEFFDLKMDEEIKARYDDFDACWNRDGVPLVMRF